MNAPLIKPPAKAYSALERAVLAYANRDSDANARAVAFELDRADDALVAAAARIVFRNKLIGPHDIAEAASLAIATRRAG